MSITFGDDPVRSEVESLLARLEAGEVIDNSYERKHVDLKEEAGRRDRNGVLAPGVAENEQAAQQLTTEAACMSNTPGGGAIIVGTADVGTLVGSELDAEWLRHRIYQITRRLLTVDIAEVRTCGVRLIVLVAPSAVEPIRVKDRILWRVNDNCVEVDAATWHAKRMRTLNYDWSNDASATPSTRLARRRSLRLATFFSPVATRHLRNSLGTRTLSSHAA